jgi:hypothetical protein
LLSFCIQIANNFGHPRGIGFAFHRAGRPTQKHTDMFLFQVELTGGKIENEKI